MQSFNIEDYGKKNEEKKELETTISFLKSLNNKTLLRGKKNGRRGKKRRIEDKTKDTLFHFYFFFLKFMKRSPSSSELRNWEHQKVQPAASHLPSISLRLSCSWPGTAIDCSGQTGQKAAP